jgi:long-chain fatty acid transport protein
MGAAVCTGAHAAGFALSDKSVSGLGAGMAGEAVYAEDASTLYNNPAGMLALKGTQATVGVNRLSTSATFTDGDSNVTGAGRNNSDVVAYIPNAYFVHELQPDLRVGFGINSPFGLGLTYDDDWMGRYHTISTNIRTFNLSPAVAYRVNEQLSVGGTIDFQYMDASLKTGVDFNRICIGTLMAPPYNLPAANAAAACAPYGDGTNKLSGDSWGTGYSLGLTYAFSPATQLGATYHSGVSHTLKGTSKFENVPGMGSFPTVFSDSDATVKVDLPESLSLGLAHAVNDRLRLLAGYTWTGWSSYKELRVDYDNTLPDTVSEEKWNDVSRYSIGAHYQFNPEWLLRAGFFYDQTPVPDTEHRTPRLPDTDRRWLTLGAKWAASQTFDLDMALAYVNEKDIPITRTDSLGHTLDGTYDVTGVYGSLQASWKF